MDSCWHGSNSDTNSDRYGWLRVTIMWLASEHIPLWSIGWPLDFLKMSIAVSGSNPCCSIKKRDTKYPVRFTPCEQWTPMAKKSYLGFFKYVVPGG